MAPLLRPTVALAAAGLAFAAQAADTCKLTAIGAGEVARVHDGRTLLLADGRELRLAAIEVAPAAGAALQKLAAGQTLRLAALAADHDRYGRLVAFAFAGNSQQSLQQALLAAGVARVGPRVGDRACAASLLATEREARSLRRGLWADPNFAPLAADNLAGLRAETGHFALVEGRVLSVHRSGTTLYLNFGPHWTSDFSVIILRRNERRFSAAGIEPRRLQGRRIRVRGFLERRRGPVIEADSPEQIELLD
jgi:endonuclease YncB( thermonuclease family)